MKNINNHKIIVQDQIGKALRVFYSHLLAEPIPERFVMLAHRLDLAQRKGQMARRAGVRQ